MEKKQDVPVLRFQGFSSEWEVYHLGDLGNLKNGMNFEKEAMGKGYPFVNLQNIFGRNVIEEGNLGKAMASASQLSDYDLKAGDVLFVRSSVKLEGVGESAVVCKDLPNTTYSGFIIRFRDEVGIDNNFKRFVFSVNNVRKQIISQATNSANKNISQSVLSSLKLSLPDKKEQERIGAFFVNLDGMIAAFRNKIQKLQQFRQAMLTKLFPREGAAEPELRFRGFSGAWRENKIADIAGSTYGGGTPSTLCREFWQGNIPWIQSSDILLDDIWRVVPHKHISKNALKKSNIRIIPKNSIAIVIRVGVGKLAFIPFSYTTSQDFLSLGNLCIDSAFATCAIKKKMEEDILIVQGTSIKGVTKNEILNKTIMIPQSVLEQQKIGNFFKGLDSFISLQQKRLERMQRLKAALLEKMFV